MSEQNNFGYELPRVREESRVWGDHGFRKALSREARREITEYADALAREQKNSPAENWAGTGLKSRDVVKEIFGRAEQVISRVEKTPTSQEDDAFTFALAEQAARADMQALEMAYKSEVVQPEIAMDVVKVIRKESVSNFIHLRKKTVELEKQIILHERRQKMTKHLAPEKGLSADQVSMKLQKRVSSLSSKEALDAEQILLNITKDVENPNARFDAALALHTLFQKSLNLGLFLDRFVLRWDDLHGVRLSKEERERRLEKLSGKPGQVFINDLYAQLEVFDNLAEELGKALDGTGKPPGNERKKQPRFTIIKDFLVKNKKPIFLTLRAFASIYGVNNILHDDHPPTNNVQEVETSHQTADTQTITDDADTIKDTAGTGISEKNVLQTGGEISELQKAEIDLAAYFDSEPLLKSEAQTFIDRVDALQTKIAESARDLAHEYISMWDLKPDTEIAITQSLENALEAELSSLLSKMKENLALSLPKAESTKQLVGEQISSLTERFHESANDYKISAEFSSFAENPVVKKEDQTDLGSYKSFLKRAADILKDAKVIDSPYDFSQSFWKKVKFKPEDFPTVVTLDNLSAVYGNLAALKSNNDLFFAYNSSLAFEETFLPKEVTRENLKKVWNSYNAIKTVERDEKTYASVFDISTNFKESVTLSEADFPRVIAGNYENIGEILDAFSSLKGDDLNDWSQRLFQENYLSNLKYPPVEIDGGADSLKRLASEMNNLKTALRERGLENDPFFDFVQRAHQQIVITGPILVNSETAGLLSGLYYKYLEGKNLVNFREAWTVGKSDEQVEYRFSPADFPLEWNWDNLGWEKLQRVSPVLAEKWLEALQKDAPIRSKLAVKLDEPLPARARAAIDALFHFKHNQQFKQAIHNAKNIKNLSDIFTLDAAPVIEKKETAHRLEIKKLLQLATNLDDEIINSTTFNRNKFENGAEDMIGSFTKILLQQIVLPEAVFPRVITAENLPAIKETCLYLKGIHWELENRYRNEFQLSLPKKIGGLKKQKGVFSVEDAARLTGQLEQISDYLARKYLKELDITALLDSVSNTPQFKITDDTLNQSANLFLKTAHAGPDFQKFLRRCAELDGALVNIQARNINDAAAFIQNCAKKDTGFSKWISGFQVFKAGENLVTPANYNNYVLYAKLTAKQFERGEIDISGLAMPVPYDGVARWIAEGELLEKDLGAESAREFRAGIRIDFADLPQELVRFSEVRSMCEIADLVDRYGELKEKDRDGMFSLTISQKIIDELAQDESALLFLDSLESSYSLRGGLRGDFLKRVITLLPVSQQEIERMVSQFQNITNSNIGEVSRFIFKMSLCNKYYPKEVWPLKNHKPREIRTSFEKNAVYNINPPECRSFEEYFVWHNRLSALDEVYHHKDVGEALLRLAGRNDLLKWSESILGLPESSELDSLRKRLNKASADKSFGDTLVLDLVANYVEGHPVTKKSHAAQFKLGKKFFEFTKRSRSLTNDEEGLWIAAYNFILMPVSEFAATGHLDEQIKRQYAEEFSLMDIPFDIEVGNITKGVQALKTQGIGSTFQRVVGKVPEYLDFETLVEAKYKNAEFQKRKAPVNFGATYEMVEYGIGDEKFGSLFIGVRPGAGGARFDYEADKTVSADDARDRHAGENPRAVFTGGFVTAGGKIPDIVFMNGKLTSALFSKREGLAIFYPDGTFRIRNSSNLTVRDLVHERVTMKKEEGQGWKDYVPDGPLQLKKKANDFLTFKRIAEKEGLSLFEAQLLVSNGKLTIGGKSSAVEANRRALVEFDDGTFGFFDCKDSVNLLTEGYLLSPTDLQGNPKPEGSYVTSPSGAAVRNAINLDTGSQDLCRIWGEENGESKEIILGSVGSVNNVITFIEIDLQKK